MDRAVIINISAACALLETTRERIYRVADAVPLLSRHLSPATIAITESLAKLEVSSGRVLEVRTGILSAKNMVAAAQAMTASDGVRLDLVAAHAALERALQLVSSAPWTDAAPYLRLVEPA